MKRFILALILVCLFSVGSYAADTGYNWGAWAFVADSNAANWDDMGIADNETETSGTAIDLDGKAACMFSIQAVEDNTGAIDGVCTVYILRDTDGTNYEDTTTGSPYSFTFDPVQNDTVYIAFAISASKFDKIKFAIKNEGGQILVLDIRYKTATIPLAS